MSAPITVLLAEDHAIVRQGLIALLKADGQFDVAGEARNGREAVNLAITLRPDVILMDIAMPVLNGLEAARLRGFFEKQTSAEILTKTLGELARENTFYALDFAADACVSGQGVRPGQRAQERALPADLARLRGVATGGRGLRIHGEAGLTRHAIATGVIESGVRLTLG